MLKTTDYASTGTVGGTDEVATTGAKMQNGSAGGKSLLVAPANLKIGAYTAEDLFLAKSRLFAGNLSVDASGNGGYVFPTFSGITAARATVDGGYYGILMTVPRTGNLSNNLYYPQVTQLYHTVTGANFFLQPKDTYTSDATNFYLGFMILDTSWAVTDPSTIASAVSWSVLILQCCSLKRGGVWLC